MAGRVCRATNHNNGRFVEQQIDVCHTTNCWSDGFDTYSDVFEGCWSMFKWFFVLQTSVCCATNLHSKVVCRAINPTRVFSSVLVSFRLDVSYLEVLGFLWGSQIEVSTTTFFFPSFFLFLFIYERSKRIILKSRVNIRINQISFV